jgi:hypothetical protein
MLHGIKIEANIIDGEKARRISELNLLPNVNINNHISPAQFSEVGTCTFLVAPHLN